MTYLTRFTYAPCDSCRKVNRLPIGEHAGQKPVCGNCGALLSIHGPLNELSASMLQLLVEKSPLPVVADFWAPWCGPCQVFAPVFENVAAQMAGELVFAKVNTQNHPLAANTYGVRGIPTLILFQNGTERGRQSGALPPHVFVQWLRSNLQGFEKQGPQAA